MMISNARSLYVIDAAKVLKLELVDNRPIIPHNVTEVETEKK